jgi:hypothetical protein
MTSQQAWDSVGSTVGSINALADKSVHPVQSSFTFSVFKKTNEEEEEELKKDLPPSDKELEDQTISF